MTPKPGSGAPARVYKALVNDLTAADFPDQMIVPYGDIVHDRITSRYSAAARAAAASVRRA